MSNKMKELHKTHSSISLQDMIKIYTKMEIDGKIKGAAIERKNFLISLYVQGRRHFPRR